MKRLTKFFRHLKKIILGRNVQRKKLLACCDKCSEPLMITERSVNNPVILYTNREHALLTGYYQSDLLGKIPTVFQGKDTNRKTIDDLKKSLSEKDFWLGQITNYHKNGKKQKLNMIIFTISIEGRHYYVVHKKLIE
jgi:hypothetical protein